MKHLLTLSFLILFGTSSSVYAQLADGSIAPNWTLTDIEGNSHTLYNYLDQGKMVIIEFSATWCGPCWNYMLTGALETVWEDHGPSGDNTAMLFYIEADQSTGMNDLLGLTPSSQGNWVEAIPFPIIDLQVGQNQDQQYQINYYPTLYAVCSDHTIWELGQVPAGTWSSFIQSCTLEAEVESVEDAVCYGEGSATVEYTGGVTPISYHWNTGDSGATLSNVGAGTYSCTVTDNGGKWVKVLNIVISGADEPISVQQSTIEQPLCNGSSNGVIDIEMEGGTPGYDYDWSNGSTNEDLTNVPAGNYSVVVTDNNGCISLHAFTMGQPDEIEVEIETSPENCYEEDGTITLYIDGGTGDYEITSSNGNIVGNQILNLPQGIVTATVEDENGCIWEDDIEIELLPAPEVEIFQGDALNCIQQTTTLTGNAWSGSGDFEYEWTTTNGHIVSGSNSETITIDEEGTYNLIVIDFVSGCGVETSYEATADIVLPVVNAGEDLPISCEVNQQTIQGTGDPLNTITWTTASGNIVGGGNTYTPVVDQPGVYYINVVHSQTGCTNTDSVEMLNQIFPANADFQYLTSSLTMITNNTSTGSNLTGWAWTFGYGGTSNDQSPVHTYSAAGIYEVCMSVQNGCGVSQTCSQVEVTSTGSVLSLDVIVNNVLCFGDSTGSIILVANGGSGNYTYVWTGPGGSSYNTPTIEDLIAGAYVVMVSDDQGNSVLGGYNVEQPSELLIGASSVVDNQCADETNGSITVELTGGVGPLSYSWNGGPPQAESSISQLSGGAYECLVTDANGCTLLVGPYSIYEPEILIADTTDVIHATGATQNDGSIVIQVIGGTAPYLITWSNGATGDSIQGLLPGEYTYSIVDAHGCTYTSPEPIVISHPVSTTEPDGSLYVTITPNPSSGEVVVKWKELTSLHSTLSVMTLDGRNIGSYSINSNEGIWDLTHFGLTEGLYIVMLKHDQKVFPFKLIVL